MKNEKQVWVVGIWRDESEWEIVGVFSAEALGLMHIRKKNYFIGPLIMNKALPDKTIPWEGAYYPILETKAEAKRRTDEIRTI